jgi:putative methyltransferase (TIGR04325 family)
MAGVKSVLDFGGACGAHYALAARVSPGIRWAVVETPAMVARASELATGTLQFFNSISLANEWLGGAELVHSSGALQYTPDPESTLKQLCDLRAAKMLWARMLLSTNALEHEIQTSRLSDNGPGQLPGLKEKAVKYGRTKIPERVFLEAHSAYKLTKRGTDWFEFVRK